MTIIWSDIQQRLYWHNAKSASKVDAMRKGIARRVKHFLKIEWGVIRHQTITFAEKRLLRYNGIHLNDLGNVVLLHHVLGVSH